MREIIFLHVYVPLKDVTCFPSYFRLYYSGSSYISLQALFSHHKTINGIDKGLDTFFFVPIDVETKLLAVEWYIRAGLTQFYCCCKLIDMV
jgi:hypothetical protein